jgi:hypothetical protein
VYESAENLRRDGFFLGTGQKPFGYIAITFAAAAGAIAGCVTTELRNARVTAGLHQWGDIWLANHSGQQLVLATLSSVMLMGAFAALMAGSFVWFFLLLFKPDQTFRQRFNFFAGALLTALILVAIIHMPGTDSPVTIDRTHGWITGGTIPKGEALSFSEISSIGTYASRRHYSTIIGALTVNGRVDLLSVSSAAQAKKDALLMQAFINGQNDGVGL